MKKIIYVAIIALALGSVLSSCSNKLCPAYASYPRHSR